MKTFSHPLLGFAAYSGTGKTTLLCNIIPLLKEKGIRIAIIKHSHHDFEIDQPNKDSYKLRHAGATNIVLASRNKTAIIIEHAHSKNEPSLEDALQNLCSSDIDLVLVEGFKTAKFPKIELHRSSLNKPYLFPNDKHIIGIATDHSISQSTINQSTINQSPNIENPRHKIKIPHKLDINNPQQIADFIENTILSKNKPTQTPSNR